MSVCDDRPLLLKSAIERLYLQFDQYSEWSKEPGCPCCVTEADCEPLLTKPLRDLTHRDLHLFGRLAVSLWGDMDDYRHFLPRLFELCTLTPQDSALDWDIESIVSIISMLTVDNWCQWAEAEKEAVENFFDYWWQYTIFTSINECTHCGEKHFSWDLDACSVLNAIARARPDIECFLVRWRDVDQPPHFHHFAQNWHSLATIYLQGDSKTQFTAWLADEQTLRWLERGLTTCAGEDWSEEYSTEIDKIRLFNARCSD